MAITSEFFNQGTGMSGMTCPLLKGLASLRVPPGFICQGGGFTAGNGTDGGSKRVFSNILKERFIGVPSKTAENWRSLYTGCVIVKDDFITENSSSLYTAERGTGIVGLDAGRAIYGESKGLFSDITAENWRPLLADGVIVKDDFTTENSSSLYTGERGTGFVGLGCDFTAGHAIYGESIGLFSDIPAENSSSLYTGERVTGFVGPGGDFTAGNGTDGDSKRVFFDMTVGGELYAEVTEKKAENLRDDPPRALTSEGSPSTSRASSLALCVRAAMGWTSSAPASASVSFKCHLKLKVAVSP